MHIRFPHVSEPAVYRPCFNCSILLTWNFSVQRIVVESSAHTHGEHRDPGRQHLFTVNINVNNVQRFESCPIVGIGMFIRQTFQTLNQKLLTSSTSTLKLTTFVYQNHILAHIVGIRYKVCTHTSYRSINAESYYKKFQTWSALRVNCQPCQ